jgi:cytoskeletal protein RodZ
MAAETKPGGFGSKLRAARERRGISLRQIANATKISVSALEALERNDISRLPGGIFSRAFVRSYASEVGLDPEETIQDFIGQFPHDSVTAGHPTSEEHGDDGAHESNRRTAGAFLALVAISIPIVGAVIYFSGAGRPAPEAPAAIESPMSGTVAAEAPEPTALVPDAAPKAAPTARPAEPPAASAPKPAPKPAPPADASPAVVTPAAPAVDRMTVGVVATGPCWVSAIVDGERIVAREFQAGERATFEVGRDIVLTAGDGAALDVTLNGADARPLGGAGQVVTVRVTPANFKEYLASP